MSFLEYFYIESVYEWNQATDSDKTRPVEYEYVKLSISKKKIV